MSGRFGVEREAVEKVNIHQIPLPDLRILSAGQKDVIVWLFNQLERDEGVWSEVNKWVARLYGLGARDLHVISDTLGLNLQATATMARRRRLALISRMPHSSRLDHLIERMGDAATHLTQRRTSTSPFILD